MGVLGEEGLFKGFEGVIEVRGTLELLVLGIFSGFAGFLASHFRYMILLDLAEDDDLRRRRGLEAVYGASLTRSFEILWRNGRLLSWTGSLTERLTPFTRKKLI